MKDNRSGGCFNRFRYANERLAQLAKQQRAAEGQRMRVEHCRSCKGWHLLGGGRHG